MHQINSHENYLIRFNTDMPYYSYYDESLCIGYYHKGSAQVTLDKKGFELFQGQFVLVNPDTDWEYINDTGKINDILFFSISKKLLSEFFSENSMFAESLIETPFDFTKDDPLFLQKSYPVQHSKLGHFLEEVYALSNTSQFFEIDPFELTFQILEKLYEEQCELRLMSRGIKARKSSTQKEVLRRLLLAHEYIHGNIQKKISIELLTSVSGMSEYHLFKSFKNVYGQTPHQFINSLKLEKAHEMMYKEKYSATEVYPMLGFNDLQSFSKAYKRKYGISPSSVYKDCD